MKATTHQQIDERLLRMMLACIAKIDSRPELLNLASDNLGRVANPRISAEWRTLLGLPWSQLRARLTEDSERGRELRQNAPFAGILTAEERQAFFE